MEGDREQGVKKMPVSKRETAVLIVASQQRSAQKCGLG